MELLAERMALLGSENAFKIGANIQECINRGQKIIRLNIGEPDFDTPEFISKEASIQLAKGNTHYCPPEGILPLRKAIAKQVSETRNLKIDPAQVVITTGGKPPIGHTLTAYANPGDEVIYPSPGFPIYESWINFVGAKAVPLHLDEEKNFRFTADDLEKLITTKTKLIFINSPSNPTGGVLTQDDLEGMAKVIKKKGNPHLRIYSDEIYEHILFDGHKHLSIASFSDLHKQTLIASGHSKSYAMTGWRLGYIVLPTIEEAAIFKNLNINTISCTPPFIQEAGREAIENPQTTGVISQMVNIFQQRRDYSVKALNAIPGITCTSPQGAFYLFPNIGGACEIIGAIKAIKNLPSETAQKTNPSKLFQMFLLYCYGVATMDRNSFGSIGVEDKHFLRLSIATDLSNLKEGIALIEKAAQDKEGFEKFISAGKYLY